MAPSKSTPAKTGVSGTKKKRGGEQGEFTLKRVKGENFYVNAHAARKKKLLTGGKAIRDRDGKITEQAAFQKGEEDAPNGRVQADKRWFGNTRVISQSALDHFRTSMSNHTSDPYSVLLKRNKLPMSLLETEGKGSEGKRPHIVDTEPFKDTFGGKAQRKRPHLEVGSFAELGSIPIRDDIAESNDPTSEKLFVEADPNDPRDAARERIYAKGTSRRIWGELYKVLDSSDVVIHVLDARDPMGTLCKPVLDFLKKEKAHKGVVFVLNKVDLVPTWVTARWVKHLSKLAPTLAFHASINNSFGKGSLIQLLRQFSVLHSDKKQISVGFIGYPNVGKSSIINTLKKKKVCTVAPIPGETKVWQYITLMRRIYLIDCPGIVPVSSKDSDTATVLKGVVRVENLATPTEHIPALLERVRGEYLERTYNLDHKPDGWHGLKDADLLLGTIARKSGKLLKGGEPSLEAAAKMVLNDWIRGKIPFFAPPPEKEVKEAPKPLVVSLPGAAEAAGLTTAKTDDAITAAATEEEVDEEEEDFESSAVNAQTLLGSKRVKGVEQPIRKIVVINKFFPDDVQAVDSDSEDETKDGSSKKRQFVGEPAEEDMDSDEDEEDDDEEDKAEAEAAEEELTWDEVVGKGPGLSSTGEPKGKGRAAVVGPTGAVADDDEEESEDEEEEETDGEEKANGSPKGAKRFRPSLGLEDDEPVKPQKEKRMTTSKKKAESYYTHANVKNKNRDKSDSKDKVTGGGRARAGKRGGPTSGNRKGTDPKAGANKKRR
ncbi:ngp1nt-domain-containing protein [Phaffia rhodozyma]|uniref:Nucleolar GTP-binding protein 2 n=1 Tax=Phaffia rhodozyma TaxID=264483 RepID=A0A0F7SRX9_PHARH|nr:ngp1nt-domain-containing protein [Phaffia rhodozyma]